MEEIPNSRLPWIYNPDGSIKTIVTSKGEEHKQGTCKFLLGATRIYFTEIYNKNDKNDKNSKLNDCLNVIAKNHLSDIKDNNLNNFSLNDIVSKYYNEAVQLKKQEKEAA